MWWEYHKILVFSRIMTLDDHKINLGVWLGENPLCLDSAEFKNQYRCILPSYQAYNLDNRVEDLALFVFTCFECLLKCLFKNMLVYIYGENYFLSLTYPFSMCLCFCLVFFLRWSPIFWCEQMWRLWVIVMLAGDCGVVNLPDPLLLIIKSFFLCTFIW